MKITRLTLTNVRAFKYAELKFTSGMNLLVGLNGMGKTTVLNVLCNMLAPVLSQVNDMRGDSSPLTVDDIRDGMDALDVTLECEVPGYQVTTTYHKPREAFVANQTGKVRGAVTETKEQRTVVMDAMKDNDPSQIEKETQLAIFFSTKRTVPTEARTKSGKSGGEKMAALSDSLSSRELRLADIAQWMENQLQLGKEEPTRLRHLEALRRAAGQLLPGCKNLRPETNPRPNLYVDKKVHGKTCKLSVRQLSDGERSMLVLVLVIAQKLSQARADLDDPIRKSEAVILVDELDLHLHPKWQRTVVERLTKIFPKCQFIATTHSPQIIAAVEPEQVIVINEEEPIRPDRTLGMDSNWILRFVLEDDERPAHAAKAIRSVEALIKKLSFPKARKEIAKWKKEGLDLPDWSVLEARMARMEVLAK